MLHISEIMGKFFSTISYQKSEQDGDEWINTPNEMKDVKASVLPQSEDDDTPPVFYNMWVNASATANDVEKAQESLETKGLTISSGSKSTYEKKDNSGNVTGYRFLIVSNS